MNTQNVKTLIPTDLQKSFQTGRLLYCFVKYKGGMLRPPSLKFFYLDSTPLSKFIAVARGFSRADIKQVEFPERQTPITQEELTAAFVDGRVVV